MHVVWIGEGEGDLFNKNFIVDWRRCVQSGGIKLFQPFRRNQKDGHLGDGVVAFVVGLSQEFLKLPSNFLFIVACHHECRNFIEIIHIFLDLLRMVLAWKDSFVFAEFGMEVPSCQFQGDNQKQALFR